MLIDMNLTCPQPPSRPHSGRKQSLLLLKCKGNRSAFYSSSKREITIPRVVIFQFVSGWLLAAVCHTVDLEETFRDVMVRVFGPRQGRKTCSRWAKKLCGHTFLNSSSTAYSRDQNIRSSHANTAVTTSRFHSHI
ncbi:Hypothetical predicted protein [Scomber scombrus]|uniref:Uncharacterized protein n=1 Tax=Scomber scombrus TaxID=13677 RepID=A0AAV1MTT0_SCOSC